MKIAIILKGPIRSNHEFIVNNIRLIKEFLKDHDVDDYIFTWNSDSARELALKNIVKNYICLEEPNTEYVKKHLLFGQTPIGSKVENAYKHFWMMKYATRTVYETNNSYDFVFYFRTDIQYSMDKISEWLTPGAYVSTYSFHEGRKVVNDIAGCASPEIMMSAWDYGNLANLNKIYSESEFPEICFEKLIEQKNIKLITHRHYNPGAHGQRDRESNYIVDIYMDPNRGSTYA